MKASVNYKNGFFITSLDDGSSRSSESAINLVEQLVELDVRSEDVTWDIGTFENKFRDIMKAVQTKQSTWAKMAELELKIRMFK